MGIKPRGNHREYLEVLSRRTPQQRPEKAFELSETGKELFKTGLPLR